jgi:hypothetical protein
LTPTQIDVKEKARARARAREEERVKKAFPILSMASFVYALLNQIPKRKCSTISTRHLAMFQVCRLAIFLTDENCIVCMYQYFLCCDKPFLTIDFRIKYTLLLVKAYMSYSIESNVYSYNYLLYHSFLPITNKFNISLNSFHCRFILPTAYPWALW